MKRIVQAVVITAVLIASPAAAQSTELQAARSAIAEQLAAFSRGDATSAYALAAPNVKRMFPDPGRFMAMVMGGYAPVTNARDHAFGQFRTTPDGAIAQEVLLTDRNGRDHVALYTLQKQEDGRFLVTGVSLRRSPSIGI